MFLRKVYTGEHLSYQSKDPSSISSLLLNCPTPSLLFLSSVLFIQLLGTTIVGGLMSTKSISTWVQANQWAFIVPLIGSLVSMGFLYWKRHSHPTNLILLGTFTLLESVSRKERGHRINFDPLPSKVAHPFLFLPLFPFSSSPSEPSFPM